MHGGAREAGQSALPKQPEASTVQHRVLQPHPLGSNKDTRLAIHSSSKYLELTQMGVPSPSVHPQ